MKFCCDKFKQDWSLRRETGINIRIIKYDQKEMAILNNGQKYGFILTVGYEKGETRVPARFINFCPHCGKLLKKHYKKDIFVNENDKSFLSF